jgi:flagellar hook-length control protein FliK
MSVSAPNPAASPAPGSSSATGATGTGVAGQTAHAHGPLTGFEALLAAFFGAQGATGDGTGGAGAGPFLLGKLAGKIAAGDKATGPDGKTKAGDDAKATGADATSTAGVAPDAALTALVPPSISALIVVPTPPTTDAASPQPGAGPALPGGSDKTAGQVIAATLAQLGAPATGGADAGKTQSAAAQTALAAATDATATAKVTTPTPATPAAGTATPPVPQIQPQPAVVEASVPPLPAPTAALTPPTPNAGTKAEPVTAAEAKDKTQTAKSTRVEGARVDAAAPNANTSAKTADAVQPISSGLAKGGGADRDPQGPVLNAKAQPADQAQTPATLDTASTTTPATLIHAAAVAVRGAPQTVANLAAQIAKKLDGRSTRFDVQLDPAGLGKVDVRVEIGGDGKMSASMAFDNPQAAAELKSRAGELQRALEQSGFDLSGGLSFDVASDSGQDRQAQGQDTDTNTNTGAAFRGRAFQTALDTTADAAPGNQPMFRQSSVSGVDIRI